MRHLGQPRWPGRLAAGLDGLAGGWVWPGSAMLLIWRGTVPLGTAFAAWGEVARSVVGVNISSPKGLGAARFEMC